MAQFETGEYRRRIAATKASMATQGIDVMLAVNPANMNYLTGYDGWSFYVHQLVVLALDAEDPIWIGRAMDRFGAQRTTFLGEGSMIGYPDDYVQSETKHPMQFVAGILKERGWDSRTLGVEKDAYYFTSASFDALSAALPNAGFKDATRLVNRVRAVKSDAEIAVMHQAARIVENAMQAAVDGIEPGVRQCDVVADIYHAQISGTAEFGGDYPTTPPMLPTGPDGIAPHLTWTDQPFKKGEGTIIEIAGCRRRYHCPLARTVLLYEPSQAIRDAAKVVMDAIDTCLEAARPGTTCEDFAAAWGRAIAGSGIEKAARLGYSIGLNYPPSWGENSMSLRAGDRTVLQENMCLHMIPGIWVDDAGIYISESFRVTESGGLPLADFPRELVVKP